MAKSTKKLIDFNNATEGQAKKITIEIGRERETSGEFEERMLEFLLYGSVVNHEEFSFLIESEDGSTFNCSGSAETREETEKSQSELTRLWENGAFLRGRQEGRDDMFMVIKDDIVYIANTGAKVCTNFDTEENMKLLESRFSSIKIISEGDPTEKVSPKKSESVLDKGEMMATLNKMAEEGMIHIPGRK